MATPEQLHVNGSYEQPSAEALPVRTAPVPLPPPAEVLPEQVAPVTPPPGSETPAAAELPLDRLLPGEVVNLAFVRKHLGDVQGNILKGHGRPYAKCIFVTFSAEARDKAKWWIRKQARTVITPAPKQLEEVERYHKYKIPGGLFGAFFLSSAGYRYLGMEGEAPGDEAFRQGMKARHALLGDRESDWEDYFRQGVHAMLLLADSDATRLNEAVSRAIADVEPHAAAVHVEHGHVISNEHGDGIEHFGYADGVSQPLFLKEDLEKGNENGQENLSVWNPGATLDLVLVPDAGSRKPFSFGSYFVFRKLEQNVKGFKEMEEKMAEALRLRGHDAERAGALLVGRFEDGTPVTLQGAEGMRHPIPNGFTYQDDGKGLKCPFQAHIRKVNPRTQADNKHRIARRGIPYGDRKPDFSDQPVGGVGLLFMCYQKDIQDQFEFMQAQWANNGNFPRPGTGLDPIIGQGDRTEQEYAFGWGKDEKEKGKFRFDAFVTMRGGEYFFAPAISFLKSL